MTGTSLDGVDAVLVSFASEPRVRVIRSGFTPFSDNLRAQISDLMRDPRRERSLARQVDHALSSLYCDAVVELIEGRSVEEIRAIGCHGQTILHQPATDEPFSWQAGDGKRLAELTGIAVVDDFRTADMQHGGQGAPLAPAFHQYAFGSDTSSVAVVNIGGIANVSYLAAGGGSPVTGFDTGPGNALSDRWIEAHKAQPYDENGAWARSAQPNEILLTELLSDNYFQEAPPKSLDTRYFSMAWLQKRLAANKVELDPAVVQSTLAAFSADSIWLGISQWLPKVQQLVLCGGGAHNQAIASRLVQVSGLEVSTTAQLGISPDDVEACAFAWLAERRMNDIAASQPSVTGASRQVVLGSINYPN